MFEAILLSVQRAYSSVGTFLLDFFIIGIFFNVLLTVHLSMILVINQRNAQNIVL